MSDTSQSNSAPRATSEEKRLTRRQAAIISAFTGVACGPFEDMHEYVRSLPGFEHQYTADYKGASGRIREAARADFLAICSQREQPDDVLLR